MPLTSHFSILPSDVLQHISLSLDSSTKINDESLRFLRLPHPRTALPSLFLPLEWLSEPTSESSSIILEIQSVSPPDERSWITGGEVTADGKLLMMTPIDPAFLLVPLLQATELSDSSSGQFRLADDLLDEAAKKLSRSPQSPEAHDILNFFALQSVKKALLRLCDVKEISPEIVVYRFSQEKCINYMRSKVSHLQNSPVLDASVTLIRNLAKDGLMEDGKEELLQLGRTRACCELISQYLNPSMYESLSNSYDFSKLQKHIDANKDEAVSKAAAAPSKAKISTAVDKKRKPAKPSRGVGELKKVNTTGMAKLSSFFSKA